MIEQYKRDERADERVLGASENVRLEVNNRCLVEQMLLLPRPKLDQITPDRHC